MTNFQYNRGVYYQLTTSDHHVQFLDPKYSFSNSRFEDEIRPENFRLDVKIG